MSNELIKTCKKSHVLLSILSQVCDFVGFKYEGGIENSVFSKKNESLLLWLDCDKHASNDSWVWK
jgi:hypothetical protein